MALVLADRVRDTTTTTGTGTVTLSGTAPTGYQTFGTAIGNGNTTYYTINAGSQWEVGIGTYTAAGTTLSRDTVLASSNSGSLVNFSAGTKDVFVTYPAEKSVNYDASGNLVVGQSATQLQVTNTASAVNYVQVTGSATGSDPTISVQGSDASRNLKLTAKGTGAVQSTTRFEANTAVANYWRLSGGATTVAPVISVLGSDTNIDFAIATKGTGSLTVTTNGSERMRVDGSGNVGIGTSSPTQRLHIRQDQSGTTAALIQNRNATGSPVSAVQFISGAFDLSDNRYAMIASDGGSNTTLQFWTGQGATPTERMRIDSSGNVGIGQASPGAKLDVTGNIRLSAANPNIEFNNGGAMVYGPAANTLAFAKGGGPSSPVETMRITSAGDVGIGTSSPASKLSVSNASSVQIQATTGTVDFRIQSIDSSSTAFSGSVSNHAYAFTTNNSERMRIDNTGAVGIGLTTPNASLHISGIRGGNGRMTQSSTGGTSQTNLNLIASSSAGSADQWFSFGVSSSNYYFIQNGTSAGSSGLVINGSNNVLINESSPSAASLNHNFEVNGDIMANGSAAGLFWANRSATPSSGADWYGWYTTSGTIYLYNPAAGNIASINATTGAYTALSDRNKKKDITPSAVGLAEILQLQPMEYRMETDAADAPKQLGFIAQEVRDHIPQAYVEEQNTDAGGNESTYIGLNDRPIIAALVKAVQELTARVAELEGK